MSFNDRLTVCAEKHTAINEDENMESAKEEILGRLKEAKTIEIPKRIELPPPYEAAFTQEELIEKFSAKLTEQTGVFYRTGDANGVLEILGEICEAEQIKSVMASEDDLINSLNLTQWCSEEGIKVGFPHQFDDREAYKDGVFNSADAGITAADFAVAESGTLAVVHNASNARLLSLAPILHIAVVQIENVVPVYENVIEAVYQKDNCPSQVSFITGPSMTGDIQGQMFKGMHGPRRLMVILIG